MPRIYKTPNRRRLNKWRSRIERFIFRAHFRGLPWFLRQLPAYAPLIEAAERAGVDLLDEIMLEHFGLARVLTPFFDTSLAEPWQDATKRNLEI